MYNTFSLGTQTYFRPVPPHGWKEATTGNASAFLGYYTYSPSFYPAQQNTKDEAILDYRLIHSENWQPNMK